MERRSDYVNIEKELSTLTVMVGNLSLSVNDIKNVVKEMALESKLRAEKLENRDERLENRINILEAYKDKVLGIVGGVSIGGTSLALVLQDKIISLFK
jgi:DNA repair ATPase RecN